ncbi:MAG: hypothetical protein ACKO2N_01580 [Tabrizicola sp.]
MPTQTEIRALPPVTISGSLLWLATVLLVMTWDTATAFLPLLP